MKGRIDKISLLLLFWIIYGCVFVMSIIVASCASADSGTFTPPVGGDCYESKKHPTTRNEARVRDEKGWIRLVLSEKLSVSGMANREQVEWLYLPDMLICGDPAGEMKMFGIFYWRLK